MVRCMKLKLQLQYFILTSFAPSFLLSVFATMPDSVTGETMSKELLMSSLLHFHSLVEQISLKMSLDGKIYMYLVIFSEQKKRKKLKEGK